MNIQTRTLEYAFYLKCGEAWAKGTLTSEIARTGDEYEWFMAWRAAKEKDIWETMRKSAHEGIELEKRMDDLEVRVAAGLGPAPAMKLAEALYREACRANRRARKILEEYNKYAALFGLGLRTTQGVVDPDYIERLVQTYHLDSWIVDFEDGK